MLIKSIRLSNTLVMLFCLINVVSLSSFANFANFVSFASFASFVNIAAAADSPVTVSVLPFSEEKNNATSWLGTPWLGNAIADLIMQNFAEIPSIHVVDHGHIREYLKELELQQTAFIDQASALQVGKISKASHVISGRFQKNSRGNLRISMLVIETASQSIQQQSVVTGKIQDINELARQLTLKFISKNTSPPTEAVLQRIRRDRTHSLPALEHYYLGLAHYDNARLPEAFGEFYAATEADSSFFAAPFWMGRCLAELGKAPHAIALLSNLYQKAPHQTEGLDAQLLAGELLSRTNPIAAAGVFETLLTQQSTTPHSLFAAAHLAEIRQRHNDLPGAYQALLHIDQMRTKVEQALPSDQQGRQQVNLAPPKRFNPSLRASSYAPWPKALQLYRKAIVQMAQLYLEMLETKPDGPDGMPEKPPRGVFLVDPDAPEIKHDHRRPQAQASIFHERMIGDHWRDDFYILLMPNGLLAKGAELALQGKLTQRHSHHDFSIKLLEFPLPADPVNNWLGVIYGQSEKISRLRKNIPFYGKKFQAIAIRVLENHGKIREWSITPRLVAMPPPEHQAEQQVEQHEQQNKGEKEQQLKNHWVEGKRVASLPFQSAQQQGSVRLPEKKYTILAMASKRNKGLHLVASLESPKDQRIHLYQSSSKDGKTWQSLSRLPINSQSDDLAPQLIRAEDGKLHLFWLSNRRGQGWELWTSNTNQQGGFWSPAQKIVLIALDEISREEKNKNITNNRLPPYSVLQNMQGEWVLASPDARNKELRIMVSRDKQTWLQRSNIKLNKPMRTLALGMDTTGRYTLAILTQGSSLQVLQSNNGHRWHSLSALPEKEYKGFGNPSSSLYSSQLQLDHNGVMTLLFGDRSTGIQYTHLAAHKAPAASDLVRAANLFPFAATQVNLEQVNLEQVDVEQADVGQVDKGYWLMALATAKGIDIRQYKSFHAPLNKENPPHRIIYQESEKDLAGNRWNRIFARPRMITPDVTAVAVGDNGRLWWGIETGVMTLHQDNFLMQDVAQGFFYHHVDQIVPCGQQEEAAFITSSLDKPLFGTSQPDRRNRELRTEQHRLDGDAGITTLVCADNALLAGSAAGRLLTKKRWSWGRKFTNTKKISAMTYDKERKTVWIGTTEGEIFSFRKWWGTKKIPTPTKNAITALVVDTQGLLWAASNGLYHKASNSPDWQKIKNPPYTRVSKLVADKQKGVWMIPGPYESSQGLVYYDNDKAEWFNPPSRPLTAMTDLAASPDGSIWVGTPFHGLYQLQRARP